MTDRDKAFQTSLNYISDRDIYNNKAEPIHPPIQEHFSRSYGTDSDTEIQQKRNLVFEERARALVKQSKFFEAINSIEEIEYEDDNDECHFGLNLLKAECYIQLGRENKAIKSIKAVKNALLSGPRVDPDLLISLSESLKGDESFLRPLILLRIASDLYRHSNLGPNDTVNGIARCIQVAQRILADISNEKSSGSLMDLLKLDDDNKGELLKKALKQKTPDTARMRVMIIDFGIEYMKEMLSNLRSIQGADPERKVLKEAWSTTHIGFVYANVKEFDKSYKIRKEGIDAMHNIYGDRAGFYHVYSVLLHNMGVVLHNSEKYAEAKEIYERTIIAKEMALDHGGKEKEKDIEDTRKALEVTRRHMLLA